MRKSFAILLVLAISALSVVPLSAQGKQYELQGLQGGSLGASDLSRGVYVVIVFASWSPRGKDVVQQANQIHEKWGGQAKVIMVDFQEDRGEVEAFLGGQNAKATCLPRSEWLILKALLRHASSRAADSPGRQGSIFRPSDARLQRRYFTDTGLG